MLVFLNRIRKSKSGFTTTIGGVFVFAILFSIVIPTFFYMQSMTSLYDNVSTEMKDFDEQRILEELDTYIWPTTLGNISINLNNTCIYSVTIARIWVVPSNPAYDAQNFTLDEKITLKPFESVSINNQSMSPYAFNQYISSLSNSTFYIKVVTERGNVFYAPLRVTHLVGEYYKYPLIILSSSPINASKNMKNFDMSLHVYNREPVIFKVDYVIITASDRDSGGQKSQIILLPNEDTEPGLFPLEFYPRTQTNTVILSFATKNYANIILVELIGTQQFLGSGPAPTEEQLAGYLLGVLYFVL